MRDTSDFDIPDSAPSAATRSSTDRVDTPATYASMTTAPSARSMRRRGSSIDADNEPLRSLGILNSTSPAWAASSRGLCPLRSFTRASLRS